MAARPAGAELTLLESGGAFAAGNLATVLGARPFAQREAGCCDLRTIHLNDGNYGTSWGPAEAAAGADSFAGINLGKVRAVSSIAFGRDNTGGHQDGFSGIYTIQYTVAPEPGVNTPEPNWINIGQLDYQANAPERPSFRHRYAFPQVRATGVRIVTDTALGQLTMFLDEIEVYGETLPRPVIGSIRPADGTQFAEAAAGLRFEVVSANGVAAAGITLTLNGVDRSGELNVSGTVSNRLVTFLKLESKVSYVAEIQVVDQGGNRAVATARFGTFILPGVQLIETGGTFASNNLASAPGAAAFAQSQAGCCDVYTANLNDGAFGTSWGPAGPAFAVDSFAGISLGGAWLIERIAFGRDNTGVHRDRYLGRYTIQYTQVDSPDATTADQHWATLGFLDYALLPPPRPSLRHLYEFQSVTATGVRILTDTPVGQLSIFLDEIEVYPPPTLEITRFEAGIIVSWVGDAILEEALELTGPWREVTGAQSPFPIITDKSARFYRLSRTRP